MRAVDQRPHQNYPLIIHCPVKGSEPQDQVTLTSPFPDSMLGARGTLASPSPPPRTSCCCRQTGLSLVHVSVVKTARSWEAWTWQELELGALPSTGCSGGSWGLHACGFLLSGVLRAQGLIGSRWQAWQMLLRWWVTVVWAGQGWCPKAVPEITGSHRVHQKLREVMGQSGQECGQSGVG